MGGWRCGRADCRGTLLNAGDGERCLLCGRGPSDAGAGTDWDLHLASLSALMRQPPGLVVSLRSSISEEMYERPEHGRKRKWLPWAGADVAYEPPRRKRRNGATPGMGRGGEKAGEIRDLYDSGLGLAEIIADGQRRLDAGLPGWKANYACAVLRLQRQRETATLSADL